MCRYFFWKSARSFAFGRGGFVTAALNASKLASSRTMRSGDSSRDEPSSVVVGLDLRSSAMATCIDTANIRRVSASVDEFLPHEFRALQTATSTSARIWSTSRQVGSRRHFVWNDDAYNGSGMVYVAAR